MGVLSGGGGGGIINGIRKSFLNELIRNHLSLTRYIFHLIWKA